MSHKKKNPKKKADESKKEIVDIEKLKSFGIIKDLSKDDIEEVDGKDLHGGKGGDTTVDTHWPTTGGV